MRRKMRSGPTLRSLVAAQPARPATPQQIQLLVGLSALPVVPMLAVVMWYLTSHQSTPNQARAWEALAVAVAVGAGCGLALVRSVPVFGGRLPRSPAVRQLVWIALPASLLVGTVAGRLAHLALPVTMGVIAGTDATLAIVLLSRSLRHLSKRGALPP